MAIRTVILAAGQGTRMKSALPKVLHELAGRPLLAHVIHTASRLDASPPIVIIGHGSELVRERLAGQTIDWVIQEQQLGTGHAMQQAIPHIDDHDDVLVLYGDVPLTSPTTLQRLIEDCRHGALALLTVKLDDPAGYGRIVRDGDGHVRAIVEHKDASEAERAIREVNTGILAVNAGRLRHWLTQLGNDNSQGEYYLTDIIAMAVADGIDVVASQPEDMFEVMGINDRLQLAQLERHYQLMLAQELMRSGVTLRDPARLDIRGSLRCGRDCSIDINVVIEGNVALGNNVSIGPNVVLKNCDISCESVVLASCVIEDARIGEGVRIGPFARIRPETVIADQAHIGNFVEVKKSSIGTGSKVNHLSYVGDSEIGKNVNIGAGTITCNYDGANKHKTIIEDDAFIGSDTQLVAPVTVGKGATIGAGTTLTKNAPPGELTLSRSPQKSINSWQRPVKKPK